MKRSELTEESSSDEEDFIGPAPPPPQKLLNEDSVSSNNTEESNQQDGKLKHEQKKQRIMPYETAYLGNLPDSSRYEQSFMHRDIVTSVACSLRTGFVITASTDGHLKFWKKSSKVSSSSVPNIDFVKDFKAHSQAITAISISHDGLLLASISSDQTFKVFDILSFDMINMGKLDYAPAAVCWTYSKSSVKALLAVSDKNSPRVYLYDGRGGFDEIDSVSPPLLTVSSVHNAPVCLLSYNVARDCIVSCDERGIIEYWQPREPFDPPSDLQWQLKSETDLYEYAKSRSVPSCLTFSHDFTKFAACGLQDGKVRLFAFETGKLLKVFDESPASLMKRRKELHDLSEMDDIEFEERLMKEKRLAQEYKEHNWNVIFDETGHFLLYASLYGIKVVNIQISRVAKILGNHDSDLRFMNISLYQGIPDRKVKTLAMATSDNPALQQTETKDPTLFCTSLKSNMFYLINRREPSQASLSNLESGRDFQNEKSTTEQQEQTGASTKTAKISTVILHTSVGDIFIKTIPQSAPKTVENFITHCKNGYYDHHSFHRVVRGFMIQTGDPLGDGTGGDSIWGEPFEDEIDPELKHDRPFLVSMANRGPNTNGSQFFITTVPTPWLDGKHTIFGVVTAGMDTVTRIENTPVRKEKPIKPITILSVDIKS